MESNTDGNERGVFWDLHVPSNMNSLPRTLGNQRMQQQLGQVVRGVIPGAGPQAEYHPNPYLQHLYARNAGENTNQVRGENPEEVNNALRDLEELQEVISQNDTAEDDREHTHAHGHTHRQGRQQQPLDWKMVFGSAAFVVILFLRLMADHILGILVFIGLSLVFYYANLRMIEIVHVTSLRDSHGHGKVLISCLWLIVFLSAQIFGIYWFFEDQHLWKVFVWQLPSNWQGDLFDLFWVTMITDHVVRYAAVIIKCLIAITPSLFLRQKKKGRFYMFIEIVIQAFRMTLPILPWVHFLYDQPKSGKLIFSAILAVIYLILKGWSFFLEYFKIVKAFKMLLVDTKFGVQPSAEEIKSRGENCPICQDDYQDPVMLSCKHIFCENCVSVWFDREKTCPMCRAEIQSDSPVWQDGSTSAHLQWY
ncbi:RING finger and transmembrane domain-containing protein 2-like [Ruditapes philippinarum]|uniref:RING finger and transmembrane domain-containing protein 2-like n=1 Tax=Ruditapes philippinarum TaxID=129788 RepID=UPI00295B0500|nr:RING finger and transmembrane domain-containing protein 2-like [Ruditapes philippinarum]XP_060561644.1 RING finger and transmembrane domain-containing protein 2-like [Ruditapes philippinarum]